MRRALLLYVRHPQSRSMSLNLVRLCTLVLVLPSAHAQTAEPVPSPASATASAPNAQRVEITGGRASDAEQRRQSTAAKIVIGREEIERFGDSNTLEVLKRLPGVTIPGAPGRGGVPRLRGMGGGFTQILIDGERIAPGFSLDSVAPEQIERIEILRAPTAETGARAIAGTINIVMREGFRKKINDINLGVQFEHGGISPSLGWTRNDSFGDWIVNSSLSLFRNQQVNSSRSHREDTPPGGGAPLLVQGSTTQSDGQRQGGSFNARLQWRDDQGTSLLITPLLVHSTSSNRALGTLDQPVGSPAAEYATSDTHTDSRFSLARLNANLNHRIAEGPRLEWRASLTSLRSRSAQARREQDGSGALLRTIDDDSDTRDRNASLGLKALTLLGEGHSGVAGLEFERNRRVQARSTLQDGTPLLTEFGDNLEASARRYSAYAQDEWAIDPQWAVHGGLRIEGITTQGAGANGSVERNTSRVLTPLLHTVWKFDEKSRDQVRASLTRSYRSPDLNQLIGRPSLNRVDTAPGPNSELTADTAGNPRLKPEVAIGIDIAFERYLAEGGVLSANLFHRRISDLIRTVVALEDVSWSPSQPRFVARPQNIGQATTQGLELEAKFRLDQLIDNGPPTDLRANASIFRSRVNAVPGPHSRLAEQPGGTLNLGADHRFRGTPLSVGGNLNHTPGYRTRLQADRAIVQSEKNVLDAYALWTFSPELKLRLSLSNALAPDTSATTIVEGAALTQTNRTTTQSFVNTQLRLEIKL
jgi:outer membrane receptor for ferrienterochelin and colicins